MPAPKISPWAKTALQKPRRLRDPAPIPALMDPISLFDRATFSGVTNTAGDQMDRMAVKAGDTEYRDTEAPNPVRRRQPKARLNRASCGSPGGFSGRQLLPRP